MKRMLLLATMLFLLTPQLIFSRIVSVIRKAYIARTVKFCAINVLTLCVAGGAYGQTSPNPPVCDRTPQVRDEIVALAGITCEQVTAAHLTILILDLNSDGITQLQSGDFNGLTNLRALWLDNNQLQSLPADIFKEALNKFVLNFPEYAKKKCDLFFAHKINNLSSLILAAHPCAAGKSDLIRLSLMI